MFHFRPSKKCIDNAKLHDGIIFCGKCKRIIGTRISLIDSEYDVWVNDEFSQYESALREKYGGAVLEMSLKEELKFFLESLEMLCIDDDYNEEVTEDENCHI